MINLLAILSLIRIKQWVKNLIVFIPLFFDGSLLQLPNLKIAIIGFVVFCLMSSIVYIINDIRDKSADQKHKTKKFRPLASGAISIQNAYLIIIGLFAALSAIYYITPWDLGFTQILLLYLAINLAYSFYFKAQPILELFFVASGFVLRLFAGAVILDLTLSPWIIMCTASASLLLVTGKRRADIALNNDKDLQRKSLARYNLAFLDNILSIVSSVTLTSYLLFCFSDYGIAKFGQYLGITIIPAAIILIRFNQAVLVDIQGDSPTDLIIHDQLMRNTLIIWSIIFAILIY
ncbi:MAG: decaprenyl-phosphate phosphoribosyltransferase [Rickettsiales bacterium]|jgi:decaprenyl-phosphate phosphoribosyltransferase|nr:decaprenyl-phosphate phosphoribosyltransferase [Rickettsiales bacterium]